MTCQSNCTEPIKFNRVKHWGESNIIKRLEENIKAFYDWGFLCIGGWKNVTGGDRAILREVETAPRNDGETVYQAYRKDWVWESGVQYEDIDGTIHAPIIPSVTGGGTVDYINGQVVGGTGGTATYSFRNVQVYVADQAPWWQELQFLTWDIDDNHFQHCSETGDWSVGAHHRVQMPTIIIQAINTGRMEPYCLGSCKVKRLQDVYLNVFAEDKCTRDNLLDLILEQDEKELNLYNPDAVYLANDYPIDCNGFLVGNKTYPDLLNSHLWACARIENSSLFGLSTLSCGLYEGTIKSTFNIIFSDL